MILLKFIFFLFFFAFILGFLALAFFFRSVKRMKNQFDNLGRKQGNQQARPKGEEVIDRRNPKQTNKQIIPDDEGEYVDFEETK